MQIDLNAGALTDAINKIANVMATKAIPEVHLSREEFIWRTAYETAIKNISDGVDLSDSTYFERNMQKMVKGAAETADLAVYTTRNRDY